MVSSGLHSHLGCCATSYGPPRVSHLFRKSLREMAERLADKYEEAKEKQEDIMNRSGAMKHPVSCPHRVNDATSIWVLPVFTHL